jgi:hypothetical protein
VDPARRVLAGRLTELFDARGLVPADRLGYLGGNEVENLLRDGPVQFVLAVQGLPLDWIPVARRFDVWKQTIQPRLIGPEDRQTFRVTTDYLAGLAGGAGYVVSEWRRESSDVPILVAEEID